MPGHQLNKISKMTVEGSVITMSTYADITYYAHICIHITPYSQVYILLLWLVKLCTVFPRVSARALISYRASKTRRLNETWRLFVTRRLFFIACFEGTVDLWSSLAAVHLCALWALPPGVKPPAFKRDPAFIQIWRLFEEIRYMDWNTRNNSIVSHKQCPVRSAHQCISVLYSVLYKVLEVK